MRPNAPALLYVLAAFGVVFGGWGSLQSINAGLCLLKPSDAYVEQLKTARAQTVQSFGALASLLPKTAELDRFSEIEANSHYGRRNAALPLALVGVILSCLLFAGCTRTMLGDPWGLGAWSLAALLSVPYQLLSSALALVTARDMARAFGQPLPPFAESQLQFLEGWTVFIGGLALVYYGTCVLYLRSRSVVSRFSGGAGRTPPSA
jgi:hypothetical protein